uniref:NAD-dependent protein deacetylase sirtuin-2 n=1 Tax=Sphaerodactylus townsendi TaxID=933632 RepID=A0ACB8FT37_9SAUR
MDNREGSGAAAQVDAGKGSGSSSPDSDDVRRGHLDAIKRMEFLRNLFCQTLGLGSEKPEKVLDELTLDGVSRFLLSEKCKKGVCMLQASQISVPTGHGSLYTNLATVQPTCLPQAIFEISYSFKQHPEPFFALARELYPGQFKPTVCHYFIRLLKEKGLLLRCYTQNIDTLERVAGLDQEDLVEAHGTFFTSHCVSSSCQKSYSLDWMKEKIFSSLIPKCEKCQSVVKPDIVFFGESLPSRFFSLTQSDFRNVDLLIIMGTSLQVQPFASLVSRVPTNTPRLLINKEKTGESEPLMALMGFGCGMDFDSEKAYRDVAWLGDCDEGCLALAELLGWKDELEKLVREEHAAIDAKSSQAVGDGASASGAPAKEAKQSLSAKKKSPPGGKEN